MSKLSKLTSKVATVKVERSVIAAERLRGRPWERIRQRVLLRDDYLCVECLKVGRVELAHEVDHIVPVCDGGGNNMENLMSMCTPCHAAKSAREEKERGGR